MDIIFTGVPEHYELPSGADDNEANRSLLRDYGLMGWYINNALHHMWLEIYSGSDFSVVIDETETLIRQLAVQIYQNINAGGGNVVGLPNILCHAFEILGVAWPPV